MSDPEQNEFREQRLANMKKLEELGYKSFGRAFARTRIAEVTAGFEEGKTVRLAGRLL